VPLATLVRSVNPGDNVLFTGSVGTPPGTPIEVLAHVVGYAETVVSVPSKPAPPTGPAAGQTAVRPRRSPSTNLPDAFIPQSTLTVVATGTDAQALSDAVTATSPDLSGITMHYNMREVGALIPTPASSLTELPATVTGPPGLTLTAERQVALRDANGTGLLVTASSTKDGKVKLAPKDGSASEAPDPPLTAPIRLLADLVPVTGGTTVRNEILGDGDPATANQSFVLQHSPLIYLPSSSGGPPESTLHVAVDRVEWKEQPAFVGQPPQATVYVVRELPGGHVEVLFGDGFEGARLPLGTSNVTATYQYGPAGRPPPPPGNLSTVLQPQPNLATVTNPVSLTPGDNPESAKQTANDAPATVRLFGAAADPAASKPLIAPGDYEELAATVTGVTRVKAYWTWDKAWQRPVIRLYAGGRGTDNTGIAAKVRAVIRVGGAPRIPVKVKPAHPVELTIDCTLVCSKDTSTAAVKAAAISALTDAHAGLFSAGRIAIGQRLYPSQVEAALTVTGVIAVSRLRIQRPEPAGPGSPAAAAENKPFDGDPGQCGYFRLPASGLTVVVEPQ